MIVAADNLTASRPSIHRALEKRDQAWLAGVCRRAEAAGARWLDLNPGYLPRGRRRGTWDFLIRTAEAACGLKLMLDSPAPADLALAVEMCSRPPVLNMATAEPARLRPVLEVAAHHGVEVVAALMDSQVPPDAEGRLSLAALIVAEAEALGIAGRRLIIDPMVMPLALPGGERHARAVIEVLRVLPALFAEPPRRLIALSNLFTRTAGAGARAAAEPFLAAAWGAGLEVVMLDSEDEALLETVGLLAVLAGERIFAPGEYA